MVLIRWVFVLLSAAVCVVSLEALRRLWRGRREGEWLRSRMAGFCDTADGVGISLLYTGIRKPDEAAELLAEEYGRYEAIVVVDGRENAWLLKELKHRYALMEVDYRPGADLPVFGVRGLYRSQFRSFRRLIVIDRERSAPTDDWDAAAEAASFDWLLPLREGRRLLPTGLWRLSAEVSRDARHTARVVTSTVGEPAMLIAWEELAAVGGFSAHPLRGIHRSRRRRVEEPVVYAVGPVSAGRGWLGAAAFAVGWLLAGYAVGGWIGSVGSLCGVLLVGGVVCAAAPSVAPFAAPAGACRIAWRWLAGKITVKNFTIS